MSTIPLSPADMKTLDQTRQRMSQLNSSLQSLLTQIHNTDPLPSWSHLTQLATVIAQNLNALSALTTEHKDLLGSLAAYPLPSYPGREHEALLEQLLRKKLEPDIEDRVAAGRAAGTAIDSEAAGTDTKREELRARWSWAGAAANERARYHAWGADYTRAEVEQGIESVVTGLKRKLVPPGDDDDDEDDDEDEDDDDEDEAMEGGEADKANELAQVGIRRNSVSDTLEFDISSAKAQLKTAMPVQAQLRFMMTGK